MHLSPVVTHTLDTKFHIHRIIAGSFQRGREREEKEKPDAQNVTDIFPSFDALTTTRVSY